MLNADLALEGGAAAGLVEDVYKRQSIYRESEWKRGTGRRSIRRSWKPCAPMPCRRTPSPRTGSRTPVSYTHLDVYKRQELSTLELQSMKMVDAVINGYIQVAVILLCVACLLYTSRCV